MKNHRTYGPPPYRVAVVHGGPGAIGELAPVARELAREQGILEPLQTATTLEGQIEELGTTLQQQASLPVTLIGHSWGAWLSWMVAARYPARVSKLLLVSSGPFEASYATGIKATRLGRLDAQQQAQWQSAVHAMQDPATRDLDVLLAQLGALSALADGFDPVMADPADRDAMTPQANVFQAVWPAAAALRQSGELLALAADIRCPVVAIHGDYDPHPAEGVRVPLSGVLADFRMLLLKHCGHSPWLERQARENFYQVVRRELPSPRQAC